VTRKIYPFEVYNRPGSVMYDNQVFVELTPTMTIIQYPRHWYFSQCERWALSHDFPEPELFGGTPEGLLTIGPRESWVGNILGIPRDH